MERNRFQLQYPVFYESDSEDLGYETSSVRFDSLSISKEQTLSKKEDSTMKEVFENHELNQNELEEMNFIDAFFSGQENQDFPIEEFSPSTVMSSAMECLSKFASVIPAYSQLSKPGQIWLLKSSVIEVLIVQAVTQSSKITSNQELGFWIEHASGSKELNPLFYQIFKPDCSCDKRAGNILLLIALFSLKTEWSMTENDSRIVSEYNNLLRNLLKSYLMTLHGIDALQIIDSLSYSFEKLDRFAGGIKILLRNGMNIDNVI